MWKTLKKICHIQKKKENASDLLIGPRSALESSNNANEYFANVGDHLAKAIIREHNLDENLLSRNIKSASHKPGSFGLLPTDHTEIQLIINNMRADCATGWDGIPVKLIKVAKDLILAPLVHIVNLSLDSGIFPTALKRSVVHPIYKDGDKSLPSNYRPISVLPSISKILETIINKRLLKYLESLNLLSENQYGFRSARSTEDAVARLTATVVKHIDEGDRCAGIFLDLAKAFDTVSIPILLAKLYNIGIRGIQHDLFTSYLTMRTQSCKIDSTVKLKNIRRCVLMNYNPATKLVDLRHYVIRATPVGLNKGTKKMVQGKIPNLNKCKDISEFFDKAALLSESEFEDDPAAQVVLPQTLATRGAAAESRSAIRLVELGPRISFQLIKVEDGLMDGEVLFHELIEKTEEEKALIKKKREEKRRQKEKRKAQQAENVKRKEREKEELKQKSLEGIKKKMSESQRLMELANAESQRADPDQDDDDDAEYYRDEVGAEPDKDLFSQNPRKRKSDDNSVRGFKKMRLDRKLHKKFHKNQEDHDKKQFKGKNQGFRNKDQDQKGKFGDRKGKFHDQKGKFHDQKGKGFQKGRDQDKRGKGQRGKDPGQKFNKQKKVFGGKFNKAGKHREGNSKGKGKGRK
ncbi:unnamed protein product [Plutella xylostella]|uniref:(diamondback moth) hypothetical protein n=1 Tax=Plutella xylostella TaxID=51655 RepID=A0A8S4GAS2_PLUXY|nr:unnamed protein product [Plutella xylostella]